jgi:hypothetical protein
MNLETHSPLRTVVSRMGRLYILVFAHSPNYIAYSLTCYTVLLNLPMEIVVMYGSASRRIMARPGDTIAKVKAQISHSLSKRPAFDKKNSRNLEDSHTLFSYNLWKGAEIRVYLSLWGEFIQTIADSYC